MAPWVPTDLNESAGTGFLSQFGVAGYEYPSDHTKHVIFQDNNEQIHELYCGLDGKWHHTNLSQDASGSPPPIDQTTLTAYLDSDVNGNQYQHVIYAARRGQELWEIYWQSGDKNTTNLTQSIPIAALPRGLNLLAPEGHGFGQQQNFKQNVFFLNQSFVCQFIRFDDGDGVDYWGFQKLSETAQAIGTFEANWRNAVFAPFFGPTAFLTGSTTNVVYTPQPEGTLVSRPIILLQGQIIPNVDSQSWTIQSLSNASAAVDAAGAPIGGAITPRLQAVHYCGSDGNLRQIHWFGEDPSNTIINHYNLNNVAKPSGAPQVLPFSRPNSYVFPPDQSTHVIYHGVDGHMHELTSTNGLDWTWLDMSVDAGLTDDQAPFGTETQLPHKAAFVFTEQLTEHVVFTSVKNHVIELKRGM